VLAELGEDPILEPGGALCPLVGLR